MAGIAGDIAGSVADLALHGIETIAELAHASARRTCALPAATTVGTIAFLMQTDGGLAAVLDNGYDAVECIAAVTVEFNIEAAVVRHFHIAEIGIVDILGYAVGLDADVFNVSSTKIIKRVSTDYRKLFRGLSLVS